MEMSKLDFVKALLSYFDAERKRNRGDQYGNACDRMHLALTNLRLSMIRGSVQENQRVNISHAFGPFGRIKIESRIRRAKISRTK